MAQVQALKPDLVPYLTSVLCGPGEQKGTIRTSCSHSLVSRSQGLDAPWWAEDQGRV